jgi:hypothetical protein
MFESAVKGLAAILDRNHWVAELAGILPLSALIDFIDIPPKLHIFQLAGAAPLWSWPVTPAGSRLLLSDDKPLQQGCYLDRYGNSVALLGLDGRWGERYNLASPETVRLCVTSHRACTIDNLHGNMNDDDKRIQNLEVIYVSRLQPPNRHELSSSWLRHVLLDPWWMYSPRYLATSILGWITLLGMIAMCIILQTYLAMAFLLVVPLTGTVIFALYGSSPRGLLVTEPVSGKRYNRLILVAEHVNAADWIVFYGESTIVNSLLNRPLEPRGPRKSWSVGRRPRGRRDQGLELVLYLLLDCFLHHCAFLRDPRGKRSKGVDALLRQDPVRPISDAAKLPEGAAQHDRSAQSGHISARRPDESLRSGHKVGQSDSGARR